MSDQKVTTVHFKSVNYEIDGVKILTEVDLQIEKGEIVVILGESGCGKTTTIRLINGLIYPTSGEVLVMGKPTTAWDPVRLRRGVGYVLQDGGLFPHMTVRQNVGIVLALQQKEPLAMKIRVEEMIRLVRLDPDIFGDRMPHELSGGQRQRVGVARALAPHPDLLLLDEPFGSLDAITRAALQKEFAALARDLDKTVVFVTHDLHEAMLLGTRIILMDSGRILFDGSPAAFRRSEIPLAQEYLETVSVPG